MTAVKIIISPDSFKGSLSAWQAALAIEEGIKNIDEKIETIVLPIGDGGEGTLEILIHATDGEFVNCRVDNPLGQLISASYGVLGNKRTAVIEMAQASGLMTVAQNELNPQIATSFGTGQLVIAALDAGLRDFIFCIGGSATNDGGVGMLRALGLRLLNYQGEEVEETIDGLLNVEMLDFTHWDSRLASCQFVIASDVTNPLLGENGATTIFGRQKGVKEQQIPYFEEALTCWANCVHSQLGIRLHDLAGAGAAGGMGGAIIAFLNGKMEKGIDLVLETMNYRQTMIGADYIITGEGQSDEQTFFGKAIMGVSAYAREENIPCILISGSIEERIRPQFAQYFDEVISVVNPLLSKQQAMEDASRSLKETTSTNFRKIGLLP